MAEFTYTLDPSSRKFNCPECGKRRFVRFVHKETKEYHEDESFGRCDRESCGCFIKPQFNPASLKSYSPSRKAKKRIIAFPQEPISYVPFDLFARSRKRYEQNNFVQYLFTLAETPIVYNRVELYNIGTAKLPGATIFWLIDQKGNIRTGKTMLYHPPGHENQGKRVKEPGPKIFFIHSKLNDGKGIYKQCLFGEHLLKLFPSHPVALVESEKTAVIASIYYSDYIWLATGGKEGFTEEKCLPLKGREVEVFPDLGCYNTWSEKAAKFSHITHFQVSTFIELNATDEGRKKDPGMDLADFLERYSSNDFNPKLLIPHALHRCSGNETTKEDLGIQKPQEIKEQLEFNKLTLKYPALMALTERLKLEVKKAFHTFSPEDN